MTKAPALGELRRVEAVDAAEEADVLIDGQQLVEREPLRHVADAPLDRLPDRASRRRRRRARCRRSACSSPHSMRMVVDLPAPLLPRNPKISPRRTSNDTLSTATNWPNRRESCLTSIATVARWLGRSIARRFGLTVFDLNGPAPARAALRRGGRSASARVRSSSACSTRDLRVEHVGAGRDAGAEALADDALAPRRRARTPSSAAAIAARLDVELEPRAAGPRTSTWRSKSSTRASARARAGARPRAAPRGARPPSQSVQLTLIDTSHESSQSPAARKDARVGARVVVAAADRRSAEARRRGGAAARAERPSARALQRLPLGPLASGLGDQSRRGTDCCSGDGSSGGAPARWRPRRVDAGQPAQIRFGDARAALRASIASDALRATAAPRRTSTSFGGIEPLVEPARRSRTCASSCRAIASAPASASRAGDERPERARDLQPQIGARRRQILSRRARARRAPRVRARRRGRRCRSATAGRAARGSCRARRDRRPAAGCRAARSRTPRRGWCACSRLQRRRAAVGAAPRPAIRGARPPRARLQLRQALAVRQAARDRLLQRQPRRCAPGRRRASARRRSADETQRPCTSRRMPRARRIVMRTRRSGSCGPRRSCG